MEAAGAKRAVDAQGEKLKADDDAARKRAAVETYARNEAALRRTARRHSLCADDADDALQRGLEILLRKAPTVDSRELIKWTQTVVKHEAMAIRRDRERILAGPAAVTPEADAEDWIAHLPASADGPPELAERRDAIARSREALQALKPQELRALTLLAEGYSYVEIGEITGYSRTKVNRCLAEGRERFRKLISSGEDGSRCAEMRPLLSAFCDGEATPKQAGELREHLRVCAHCRATLRAYRAAPGAAAALAPIVPIDCSLLERIQEAVSRLGERLGGNHEVVSQVVTGGVARAGATASIKGAAACLATAGGVVACVASGLVPTPLAAPVDHGVPPDAVQPLAETRAEVVSVPKVPMPLVEAEAGAAQSRSKATPQMQPQRQEEAPQSAEPDPEPASEASGAPESTPPPASAPEPVSEAATEPSPAAAPSGGNPAGEFGP